MILQKKLYSNVAFVFLKTGMKIALFSIKREVNRTCHIKTVCKTLLHKTIGIQFLFFCIALDISIHLFVSKEVHIVCYAPVPRITVFNKMEITPDCIFGFHLFRYFRDYYRNAKSGYAF